MLGVFTRLQLGEIYALRVVSEDAGAEDILHRTLTLTPKL